MFVRSSPMSSDTKIPNCTHCFNGLRLTYPALKCRAWALATRHMSLVTVFTFFLFNHLPIVQHDSFPKDNLQFSWDVRPILSSLPAAHPSPIRVTASRYLLFLITSWPGLDLIIHETFFPTLSYLSPSAGPPPAREATFHVQPQPKAVDRKGTR